MATDWKHIGQQVLEVVKQHWHYLVVFGAGAFLCWVLH